MTGKDEGRAGRLKAALRDNLRRRKAQAQARGAEGWGEPERAAPADAPETPHGAAPDSDKTRL